jgi:membrane protein YqaA with SNARE-associated domain
VARFSDGWGGARLIFLWAASEATVMPIIADFLLLPMAAVSSRRFGRLLFACVAGMAAGGAAGYLWALRFPERYRRLMERLPLTPDEKIPVLQDRLQRYGVAAFLTQPFSGVPMKVWAAAAASLPIDPWRAISVFVAARAFRMALVAVVARLVVRRFHGTVRRRFLLLCGLYGATFAAVWSRMASSGRRGGD